MTYDELRDELIRIVNVYVDDFLERERLLSLVRLDEIPVKGVLSGLTPFLSSRISSKDSDVIKNIVFYFC